MPRLIFVNRYFFPDHSATSQMLTDLAFALAHDSGLDIHVVTSRQAYDSPTANFRALESVGGVTVHRVWTSHFGRNQLLGRAFDYFSFYLSAFVCLLRLAEQNSIMVAKTDPPMISVVAAVVAKLKSAVLVNWVQDLFPEVAASLGVKVVRGPLFSILKRARNASLRLARCNVVIGELMAERLIKEGVPVSQVEVIHNWADGTTIRPIEPEANPLRTEWGLDGKFVVGYSGNLGRSHEFATILDAATQLQAHPDILFLFIGGGANLQWVEQQVASRGLTNVMFKPYQARERLAESLSAADVHLITLKPELEGLIVPSKFYGIAAAGRPVAFIGDDDGEIGRLVRQAQCGFSVSQGNGEALRNQLLALYRDANLRRDMGNSARTAFDRMFSLKTSLDLWEALIRRLSEKGLSPIPGKA